MTALATALAFARPSHGHAVLPVNWPVDHGGKLLCSCGSDGRGRPCGRSAAKHPYGKLAPRGLLSATTDAGIIKAWFGYQAPEANLGVVTDKLVVLDVDPRHGGDSSLRALEREHGELPATWRVLTGGDGEHVLFAAPNGVIIGNVTAETTDNPPLGPGIDVRARGGYIVAPPSQHISGKVYAWSAGHHPKGVALTPAPDWLIERLTARPAAPKAFDNEKGIEPTPSDVWSKLTQQPVTEYHDAIATKIAGHLFRQGVDYQLIVGMMHAWNSSWCSPPLGHPRADADRRTHCR